MRVIKNREEGELFVANALSAVIRQMVLHGHELKTFLQEGNQSARRHLATSLRNERLAN